MHKYDLEMIEKIKLAKSLFPSLRVVGRGAIYINPLEIINSSSKSILTEGV